VRRAAFLAAAAILYVLAAWTVAPGFYDGFGPPAPYNWTCPPPQAGANMKPGPGHTDFKVVGGISDAGSAYDRDGQIVIGFLPGAFDPAGKTTIAVDVTPLDTCPQPPGIQFVTNVYHVTGSASILKAANLVLRFSNLEPAPADIYFASDPAGPWKGLGIQQQAQPFTVVTTTKSFGYFAAGYLSTSPPPGAPNVGGGSQTLPIIVAVLIVLVILAGIPLAMLRRRQSRGEVEEEGDV
jgi:hypothetical protein